MVGWTKADYDDAYLAHVDRRVNATVAQDPAQTGGVVLHYHRWFMGPILQDMWVRLAPILNIASTEYVCIVGCGFGWGVDAFISETGATTVGVDVSDYINDEHLNTEEAEIDAELIAKGLNPATGRGSAIKAEVYNAQPRSNIVFLHTDMSTANERQQIRAALGGNWPSVVIYEDLIGETTTDLEITNARNAGNGFGGTQRLIWVTGKGYPGRTLQQLQTLTGDEVITRDGQNYLVP